MYIRTVIRFAWLPVCIDSKMYWLKFYKEIQRGNDVRCRDTGIFMYVQWIMQRRFLLK